MNKLILPKTKDGKPKISYSQYSLWRAQKGYNTRVWGKTEYIEKYFFDKKHEDIGFAQFGREVEAYIRDRSCADAFSKEERSILNKIPTLDVQDETSYIDFGDFVAEMIVDDRASDWSVIRDYKTGSYTAERRYRDENYKQLDFYALKQYMEKGQIPQLEVVLIRRDGDPYKAAEGRSALKVGNGIKMIKLETDGGKLQELKADVIRVAHEISDVYQVFQKTNNKSKWD